VYGLLLGTQSQGPKSEKASISKSDVCSYSPIRPAARISLRWLARCSLITLGACGCATSHSGGRTLGSGHSSRSSGSGSPALHS